MTKYLRWTTMVIIIASLFLACEKDDDDITPDDQTDKNEWVIEVIDSIAGASVGEFSMLSLDKDSGLHVAYTVDNNNSVSLNYAYKAYMGQWVVTVVANALEKDQIDIATDSDNNVYIIYTNKDDEKMYLAEKSLSGSFIHKAVSSSTSAAYPSLWIDNANLVHIVYANQSDMRYTNHTFGGSFIDPEPLDDSYRATRSGIVGDNNGNIYVLWHDNDDIIFGAYKGMLSWEIEKIATGGYSAAYEDVGLKIDKNDRLHGYFMNGQQDNNIHYISKLTSDTEWTNQTIGNDRAERVDRAIAIDTLNNPCIAYGTSNGNSLKIARKSSSWIFDIVHGDANYNCGYNSDMTISDKNRIHISFYCTETDVLLYATKILD